MVVFSGAKSGRIEYPTGDNSDLADYRDSAGAGPVERDPGATVRVSTGRSGGLPAHFTEQSGFSVIATPLSFFSLVMSGFRQL